MVIAVNKGLEVPGPSGFVELPAGYDDQSPPHSHNAETRAGPAQATDPTVVEGVDSDLISPWLSRHQVCASPVWHRGWVQ